MYGSDASLRSGSWNLKSDPSAVGGTSISNPDAGAGKLLTPLADPVNYFELKFTAEAGRPYRLWVRGKAEGNDYTNDSVYVQFSGSVTQSGAASYRIGTASATTVVVQDCSACPLSNWGWADNGYGTGVSGSVIYFAQTGAQTLRIQTREDGLSIDQVVLSSLTYLNQSPGATKDDATALARAGGILPAQNVAPQVQITPSVTSGGAPLTVSFTTSASDPDGYISDYKWSFGDGQTSTLQQPSVTYRTAGTYIARLTVTDNGGASASATAQITVTGAVTGTSTELKVMTFNIAMGKGTDGVVDLDRTASYIAKYNPDIAALSEIQKYSGSANQTIKLPQLMQQKTGRTWYLHFVPKYVGTTEGMAILSKYPFVSTSGYYLSYGMSVVQAKVKVGSREVNFFSTHLDWESSYKRYVQAQELVAWAAKFAEPRVIAGDFNAWADQSSIGTMETSYFDAWAEAVDAGVASSYADNPVNWNTRTRKGRIDYIFYSKGSSVLQLKSAQTPDIRDLGNTNVKVRLNTPDDKGVRPSDHNLVTATFVVR